MPPAQARRVVLGLLLAIFLGAIDQTIVSVALLSIGRELHNFALIPWVVAGYLVASTVCTPIYGKLSDVHGRRPILLFAIGLHLVASVLCALSDSMSQLIAFRILQGLGSGGVLALVQSAVADIAPGAERGRYQGYLSGTFAVAAVLGPVLGGYLTHYLSWRAIFWIHLPLAALAFVLARRALRHESVVRRPHRIDYAGALLLAGAVASVLVALTRIGQGRGLTDPLTLGLLLLGVLLSLGLAWQERRAAEPLMPPALLANPVLRRVCAVLALQFFVLIGCSVMLPLAMQSIGRAAPDDVALRMIPLSLSIPFGAFTAGRIMFHTARYRGIVLAGGTLTSLGVAGIAFVAAEPPLITGLLMTLLGIGLGLTMPPCLVAAQGAAPHALVGVATSMTALFRSMGGSVGIALLSSVLFLQLGGIAVDAPAGTSALLAALGGAEPEPLRAAFTRVFGIAAVAALGGVLLAWKLPERKL
jgi:EmrB/QacA subfamily drug resistance transporter